MSGISCVTYACSHYDLTVSTLASGVSWGIIQHIQGKVFLAYLIDQHHCANDCLERSGCVSCKSKNREVSRRDGTADISGDEEYEGRDRESKREVTVVVVVAVVGEG